MAGRDATSSGALGLSTAANFDNYIGANCSTLHTSQIQFDSVDLRTVVDAMMAMARNLIRCASVKNH